MLLNILTNTLLLLRSETLGTLVTGNIVENVGFVVNRDGLRSKETDAVYGVKISGSSKCIISNNVIFNNGKDGLLHDKAVGVYLGDYDGFDSNYTMVTGNNIGSTLVSVSKLPPPEAKYSIITNNQINNANRADIDTNHNGSFTAK